MTGLGNQEKRGHQRKKGTTEIFHRRIYHGTYSASEPKITKVGLMNPEDRGSIPGRVIPKTQKMLLDAASLNTQHYKVRIKDKVE